MQISPLRRTIIHWNILNEFFLAFLLSKFHEIMIKASISGRIYVSPQRNANLFVNFLSYIFCYLEFKLIYCN